MACCVLAAFLVGLLVRSVRALRDRLARAVGREPRPEPVPFAPVARRTVDLDEIERQVPAGV